MQNTATTSPLSVVPAQDHAPVKPLLSAEEKQFLDLVASIFVKDIIQQHKSLTSQTTES
jgi:hypothetical protein